MDNLEKINYLLKLVNIYDFCEFNSGAYNTYRKILAIGKILKSISLNSGLGDLFSIWKNWSDICDPELIWNTLETGDYTIRSLEIIAKNDHIEKYLKYYINENYGKINYFICKNNKNIVKRYFLKFVKNYYQGEIVKSNGKLWYYNYNQWISCDDYEQYSKLDGIKYELLTLINIFKNDSNYSETTNFKIDRNINILRTYLHTDKFLSDLYRILFPSCVKLERCPGNRLIGCLNLNFNLDSQGVEFNLLEDYSIHNRCEVNLDDNYANPNLEGIINIYDYKYYFSLIASLKDRYQKYTYIIEKEIENGEINKFLTIMKDVMPGYFHDTDIKFAIDTEILDKIRNHVGYKGFILNCLINNYCIYIENGLPSKNNIALKERIINCLIQGVRKQKCGPPIINSKLTDDFPSQESVIKVLLDTYDQNKELIREDKHNKEKDKIVKAVVDNVVNDAIKNAIKYAKQSVNESMLIIKKMENSLLDKGEKDDLDLSDFVFV